MKEIETTCFMCQRNTRHIIGETKEEGIYDSICRVCKVRSSMAVGDKMLGVIDETPNL